MPLSLFHPPLNISLLNEVHHLNVIPSTYPAPAVPDVYECAQWYAEPQPATPADCQIALNLLPSGNADEPFSYHFDHHHPNRLPITVAHGTCEIIFSTSGETASLEDPIIINPTDIRNMAGWVIDQCVKDERIGGAITKNLKHATDWILDPASDFFDDRMPKSTTFLSLFVWNWSSSQDTWNAGKNDPSIGYEIGHYVYKTVQEMPESDEKIKLEIRADVLSDWVVAMDYGKQRVWWNPHNRRLQVTNPSDSRGVANVKRDRGIGKREEERKVK